MPDNAAGDRRAGSRKALPLSAGSLVRRQRVEIPVERKWPRAWRLLFLIAAAAFLWLAVVLAVRLI